jgi:hypothetical protein
MYCRKLNYELTSQEDFGDICGRSKNAQIEIEKGKTTPKTSYWDVMLPFCASHGIKFLPQGGFMIDENIVQVFEGEDCYLKLQEDILRSCNETDEVLFLGCDDRKSNKKVIENEQKIYDNRIFCKYLISKDNDFIIGPKEDYRKTDSKYFIPTDLTVIYKGKIAFDAWKEYNGKRIQKIVVLNEQVIFDRMKKYFYDLWKNASKINKTLAKQIIFKK